MPSVLDRPDLIDATDPTAFNLAVWEKALADPMFNSLPHPIETDRYGQIILSPPPAPENGEEQFSIGERLHRLVPAGKVITECPISTSDGVKLVDVAWTQNRSAPLRRGRSASQGRPKSVSKSSHQQTAAASCWIKSSSILPPGWKKFGSATLADGWNFSEKKHRIRPPFHPRFARIFPAACVDPGSTLRTRLPAPAVPSPLARAARLPASPRGSPRPAGKGAHSTPSAGFGEWWASAFGGW
jgi:uncharacterized protein YbdZ (MbtH family)